jgi:hypothetical protein
VELLHVPTLPERLHRRQLPLQALLQHTPSTQNPDAHWHVLLHDAPFARLALHAPLTHTLPVLHWLASQPPEQLPAHAPEPLQV